MTDTTTIATEGQFEEWLWNSVPGSTAIYHVGFLTSDRDRLVSKLPDKERREVSALADRVWGHYVAGRVALVQQRVFEGRYHYLAQRTSKDAVAGRVLAAA